MVKILKSGRSMFEKNFKPLLKAQKSIGPEGLHKALCRSFPEMILEGGPIQIPFCQSVIKGQEFVLLTAGNIHLFGVRLRVNLSTSLEMNIGIAEQRAKIVEGASEAHPLEVDEAGVSVADHPVLGLEIPVHETAHRPCKPICQS